MNDAAYGPGQSMARRKRQSATRQAQAAMSV